MSSHNTEGGSRSDDISEIENTYLKLQQSQMVRTNIQKISQILNTGLNNDALDVCVKLIEAGVHPQALAEVINQIRREMADIESEE